MIRIFLTSSTDFTFDRAIAWAFDAANNAYGKLVRHLEDTTRRGGWIGAMLILEPRLLDKDVAIEIGRIRPKQREAEFDVFNIFVHCRSAAKAAATLSAAIAGAGFGRDAVVAIGSEGGDEYKVVWPESAGARLELF